MSREKVIKNGKGRKMALSVRGVLFPRICESVCILLALMGVSAMAEDTNGPPMSAQDFFEGGTNTYNNWVEFSAGGFLPSGNRAQAQAVQNWNSGGFGGIQDLHLQDNVTLFTNTTVTLDGHSIYDQHNYDVNLRLEHPEKWFMQVHANNFRTWSDGIGGFYPPTGMQYYGPKGSTPLALDQGEYSFLGGVTPDGLPSITFGYTHSYRYGNENSTIWGPTHPNPPSATVQGLAGSLYNIDERVDAFDLNAKKTLWDTDLAAGLHYEHGDLNDGLATTFYPGEPAEYDRTITDKNTYNLFSATATGEKWIKQHVFVSAGGMVANLDNHFSGSQIYGNGFGVPYIPGMGAGLGYYNMIGDSHLQEYVMDLNVLTLPISTLAVIPGLRAEKESWNGNSTGTGTLPTFPSPSEQPFSGQSSRDVVDVCESLDVRYTGFTNWVLSAGSQWEESDGNLNQFGGLSQIDGIGVPPVTNYVNDTSLLQKYSAGASWYPLRQLAFDFGGYYKYDSYNYSASADSTPDGDTYPGYFTVQDFRTSDGNCRVTLHVLQSLSLISRYEYQLSFIDTTPSPDPALGISGTGMQTSRMHSHVIGQNISWIPWSRLSLEAGFSYVLSTTRTPASEATAAILNAENNYWTLNFSPSLVLDDKTDLNVGYFYYQANDYQNNSTAGVPLGAGSREQAVTATLTRRINARLRVSLKYGYYDYKDALTGGNSDFHANLVMATMQLRF
ncbi:MAG TPA: hypothetical protein VME24_06850 [Alphaproteobacteria bacterium]|nr:hypothetical protein [Alphaproteobacteria bacterium]